MVKASEELLPMLVSTAGTAGGFLGMRVTFGREGWMYLHVAVSLDMVVLGL